LVEAIATAISADRKDTHTRASDGRIATEPSRATCCAASAARANNDCEDFPWGDSDCGIHDLAATATTATATGADRETPGATATATAHNENCNRCDACGNRE
jgi:hypothetical protein